MRLFSAAASLALAQEAVAEGEANPVHELGGVSMFNDITGLKQSGFNANVVLHTTLLLLHKTDEECLEKLDSMQLGKRFTEPRMLTLAHGDIETKKTAGLAKHLNVGLGHQPCMKVCSACGCWH
jgi:hypothetical protein